MLPVVIQESARILYSKMTKFVRPVWIILAATANLIAPAAASAPPPTKPAHAQQEVIYHLLGFSLSGTKRVDTDALVASLPQHEGEPITQAQITADTDRMRLALKARHVHGDLTTALLEAEGRGHHIWVLWDIQPDDVLSNLPLNGKRYFAGQTFSGNQKLTTEALSAATGFHQGDKMPIGSIGDARTGIEQAYDTALRGAPVKIIGKIKIKEDRAVTIDWQITEPK